MHIVCPTCSTRYEVSALSIGADGRSVRCARCQAVWVASSTEDAADIGPAAAISPISPNATAFDGPAGHPIDLDAGQPPSIVDETAADTPPDPNASLDGRMAAEVASLAAYRTRRHGYRRSRGKAVSRRRLPLAIAALLLIIGGLIGLRAEIVRRAPQMASLYSAIGMPVNLRKLAFTDVRTTRETKDGVPVLIIEGTIVSTSATPLTVPRLRLALRNAAGAELTSWTAPAPQAKLAPFESLAFQSRLASPPDDGRDIVVRFFNRHDTVASLH